MADELKKGKECQKREVEQYQKTANRYFPFNHVNIKNLYHDSSIAPFPLLSQLP
jgi:hypothetical protein